MLDRRDERDRLVSTLNRGSATGWNDDEPAVVEVAAELALRRYFGPGVTDPEMDSSLGRVVTAGFGEIKTPLDAQLAYAGIRSALGVASPSFDALKPADKYLLRGLLATLASVLMDLDEAAVDELVREAERITFERGWHPPLAPRGNAMP